MERTIIYVDNFLTTHGYTPTTGSTLVKLFRQEGYKVIPTSNKKNKALRLLDMLQTIITNKKNAVVLIATYSTSAFYFAYACATVCKLFSIKYITCLHGGNLPQRIKKSPKLAAKYFGNSFINVAVSGYLHRSMIDNGWKSVIIPNIIQLANYPSTLRTICSPNLFWLRSFHHIYNPLLAIEIVDELKETFPAIKLTMVGPDKNGTLADCIALVEKKGLQQQVTFTGLLQTAAWTTLAKEHDIFINTTNHDNAPVSVVEAMAMGLVIISTNVGGVPYIVNNNANGILVSPGNKDAFVAEIKRVIADPLLAGKLSSVAIETAKQYDWQNIKVLWKNLFKEIQ